MKYLRIYKDEKHLMLKEARTQKLTGLNCLIYQGWLWRSLREKDIEDTDFIRDSKSNLKNFSEKDIENLGV